MDENYELALQKYSQAIDQDDTNNEFLLKRSACYAKLNRFTGRQQTEKKKMMMMMMMMMVTKKKESERDGERERERIRR